MPRRRGAWYARQLEKAKQKRAAAAALRPPKPPGIRRDPERYRAYNREWMRAHYGYKPRAPAKPKEPKAPPPPPIPVLDPHPLVDEAVAQLRPYERSELGSDMDSVARDLVGEYVLASLDGGDPDDAMRRERSRYRHDRAALVFGTSLVDGLER